METDGNKVSLENLKNYENIETNRILILLIRVSKISSMLRACWEYLEHIDTDVNIETGGILNIFDSLDTIMIVLLMASLMNTFSTTSYLWQTVNYFV